MDIDQPRVSKLMHSLLSKFATDSPRHPEKCAQPGDISTLVDVFNSEDILAAGVTCRYFAPTQFGKLASRTTGTGLDTR